MLAVQPAALVAGLAAVLSSRAPADWFVEGASPLYGAALRTHKAGLVQLAQHLGIVTPLEKHLCVLPTLPDESPRADLGEGLGVEGTGGLEGAKALCSSCTVIRDGTSTSSTSLAAEARSTVRHEEQTRSFAVAESVCVKSRSPPFDMARRCRRRASSGRRLQ